MQDLTHRKSQAFLWSQRQSVLWPWLQRPRGWGALHASLVTSPCHRAASVTSNDAGGAQCCAKVSKDLSISGLGVSFPLILRRLRATWFCCVKETHASGFFFFWLCSFILDILSMPFARLRLEVVSISHLGCYFQGMVIWSQHLFRAAAGQGEVSVQTHLLLLTDNGQHNPLLMWPI